MTGSDSPTTQSKDGVGRKGSPRSRSSRNKSETRSRIFRELVHIAAEQGASIELGVSTGDALQQCLDRAVALWRFATDQVDGIQFPDDTPPDGLANLPADLDPFFEVLSNPQGPDVIQKHRWVIAEQEARLEIEKLAAMMTQLGIAERVVRVEEAKAALLIAAVREAAIEAGLDNDQVRQLGQALRAKVEGGLGQQRAPLRAKKDVPTKDLAAAMKGPVRVIDEVNKVTPPLS